MEEEWVVEEEVVVDEEWMVEATETKGLCLLVCYYWTKKKKERMEFLGATCRIRPLVYIIHDYVIIFFYNI